VPIVRLMVTGVAVTVPETQLTVIADVPVAAVEATVNVIAWGEVIGDGTGAVTPVGRPVIEHVTAPLNPFWSVTVSVAVPAPPGAMVRAVGEAETVKPGGPVTMSVIVVLTDTLPEVPVMVTTDDPIVAAALAENVMSEVVVVGLVPNVAVTPVGRPDAVKVTLPLNGGTSVNVMVVVQLPPWGSVQAIGEGLIVKFPGVTVSVIAVVAEGSVPDVPVMVIG